MNAEFTHIFDHPNVALCTGDDNQVATMTANIAREAGHGVAYLTYPGSVASVPDSQRYEIDMDHLKEANRYLMRANKSMHRSWPRQQLAQDNSLRRDSWMVRWAHSVYVIGLFTQDASLLKINTDIAWSAQMYVDRFLYDQEPMELCELYLFDMKSEAWYQWQRKWERVHNVPNASGVYTVVGEDRLTNAGKEALRNLWTSSN